MFEYPASIIATGEFDQLAIKLEIVDAPTLPENIIASIEERWTSETALNPELVSGPLLSPVDVTCSSRQVRVTACVTDYKTFMGTTADPSIPEPLRRRAIGVAAVTISADGFVLVGVRSTRVDWGTLRHVLPAGRLKPSDQSVFRGITIEFEEELGPNAARQLKSLVCVGLVRDETFGRLNYEFVFLARSALTAAELIDEASHAESAIEHSRVESYPWDADSIGALLLADPTGFVPSGWAALAICVRHDFGDESFPMWKSTHTCYEAHMRHRLNKTGIDR